MTAFSSWRHIHGVRGWWYLPRQKDSKLQEVIKEIQNLGLNIEDQGHPADYAGVNIKKLKDGSYEFTQRGLIDSIIDDVGHKDAKVKPVPAKVSLQLHAFKDEPTFNLNFNYRSAVGKLNYLPYSPRHKHHQGISTTH